MLFVKVTPRSIFGKDCENSENQKVLYGLDAWKGMVNLRIEVSKIQRNSTVTKDPLSCFQQRPVLRPKAKKTN